MIPSRQTPAVDALSSGRRSFLAKAGGATALVLLRGEAAEVSGNASAAAAEQPARGYIWLGSEEAAFVEALVDVMCPADEFTARGTDCGLATFFDRQLAGAFGQGERLYRRGPWRPGMPEDGWQWPLTPAEFFRVGLAAADAACARLHGKKFAELSAPDADTYLTALADGKITDPRVSLAGWFEELVYPLFTQACFADPIYGGNGGKVFWKMIGYPGLPAVNGINMIKYRGRPFPGAKEPKSMEDFG